MDCRRQSENRKEQDDGDNNVLIEATNTTHGKNSPQLSQIFCARIGNFNSEIKMVTEIHLGRETQSIVLIINIIIISTWNSDSSNKLMSII